VIISAAVFDDLLSLFLLAVLTSLLGQDSGFDVVSLVWLTGKVLVFFALAIVAGRWLFPWVGDVAERRLQTKHVEFTVLMTWGLAFSVLAELLGLHFVIGAFAAGLFFTKRNIDEIVHRDVHVQVEAITLGFFAPIFFASIGLNIDLRAITAIPGFLLALIAAAFLGKLLGAGLAAWCCGLRRGEAFAVGVGMNARGAVELIVAGIALRAGLFSHPEPPPPVVANLFSAVVLMAILAAVISPIALRAVVSRASGS
jgi:Kef-type K+ transport system membrane component KefB